MSILSGRRAVVFDAYGTLFDVNAAVARHAAALGDEAARVSEVWRQKQLEYSWILSLAGRYEPFWTLTERALDHALARCEVAAGPDLRAALLAAYREFDAYPEVPATLRRLREAGYRTAILSNGDPAMLAAAVAAAGLREHLDGVLSVDAAGVFKTSPRAYALVQPALGAAGEAVAFVSSNRWDVAGAAAYGFAAVWLNRAGLPDEYPDLAPRTIIRTLDALV